MIVMSRVVVYRITTSASLPQGIEQKRGESGRDGTFSDVPVISIVWFVMIGDFQSRGKEN
jgi:hypothetical protein